jgi:hypothetical protein
MTKTTDRKPIAVTQWQSNGSINPLIRTDAQLRAVAGHQYRSAIHSAAVAISHRFQGLVTPDLLTLAGRPFTDDEAWTDGECSTLFAAYLECTSQPFWMSRKALATIKGKAAYTTAQLLAIAGNLNCRAECCDYADLRRCFQLSGSFNEFDAEKAVRHFGSFNAPQYYNDNNPNNGKDAFKYKFGFECSMVVYIQAVFYGGLKVITPGGEHYAPVTPDDFKSQCEQLGNVLDADENFVESEDSAAVTWRLWWD